MKSKSTLKSHASPWPHIPALRAVSFGPSTLPSPSSRPRSRALALTPLTSPFASCMQVLERAVYGMLPKNKLRKRRMFRLRIFPDADHPLGEFLDSDNPTSLFRCRLNLSSPTMFARTQATRIHAFIASRMHILAFISSAYVLTVIDAPSRLPSPNPCLIQPVILLPISRRDKYTMAADDEEDDFDFDIGFKEEAE